MSEIPKIEVKICIAVNENGLVRCCVSDPNYVQQEKEFSTFLKELKESKSLWYLKHVKTAVPLPVGYEEIK